MATVTLGTASTSTLTALLFSPAAAPADFATIGQAIRNDQINGRPILGGAFGSNGLLYVPNRGVLRVFPGDFVAIDATTGWPILLSAIAASSSGYIHS